MTLRRDKHEYDLVPGNCVACCFFQEVVNLCLLKKYLQIRVLT